jgi:hypothetical protein
VATFHMPTTTEGKKKLAQVMKRQGPLPDQLFKKLFTYDAFMLNVGRINLSEFQLFIKVNTILTGVFSILDFGD